MTPHSLIQQTNEQTPDGSDEEDNRDLDYSDDEYGYTDYWPIRHTESGTEPSVSIDMETNDSPMSQDSVCPEHSKQNTVHYNTVHTEHSKQNTVSVYMKYW